MRPLSPKLQLTLLIVGALLLLGLFPKWREKLQEQERSESPLRAGLLLVARPGRGDGNFDKTVVLLMDVTPKRTWGLVLNRLRTPGGDVLPVGVDRWGGPVWPERRTTLKGAAPEGLPEGKSLTFAGLSAWGPGQLEHELAQGGWVVVEGGAERAFSEPGMLWAECIAPHL